MTLAAMLLTWAVLRLLSPHVLLYGRRRWALAVLVCCLWGALSGFSLQATPGRWRATRCPGWACGTWSGRASKNPAEPGCGQRHHLAGPLPGRPAVKKRAWLSLGLVVLIALTGVLGNLLMTTRQPLPDYHLMLDAARRMERGLAAIREEKTRLGIPVNPEEDRHLSGVIGAASSPITTTLGPLAAKRSSAPAGHGRLSARLLRRPGCNPGSGWARCSPAPFRGLTWRC